MFLSPERAPCSQRVFIKKIILPFQGISSFGGDYFQGCCPCLSHLSPCGRSLQGKFLGIQNFLTIIAFLKVSDIGPLVCLANGALRFPPVRHYGIDNSATMYYLAICPRPSNTPSRSRNICARFIRPPLEIAPQIATCIKSGNGVY